MVKYSIHNKIYTSKKLKTTYKTKNIKKEMGFSHFLSHFIFSKYERDLGRKYDS